MVHYSSLFKKHLFLNLHHFLSLSKLFGLYFFLITFMYNNYLFHKIYNIINIY